MAKILDERKFVEKILNNFRKKVEEERLELTLAVVLVGENPISKIFIKKKEEACRFIGVNFKLFRFSPKIDFPSFKKEIKKIAENPINSGVIIQLPLPKKLDSQEIFNIIPERKDLDVLSEQSLGKFYTGSSTILPPVVGAVSRLLERHKIPVRGRSVVLVGAGRLVGLPLAVWLTRKGATVSIVSEFTADISFFTRNAEIVISGAGKAGLITEKLIKRGAVIIDAGTSFKKGKLTGDVDFNRVSKKAGCITPVPGGVGPLVVASLLGNLIKLSRVVK